MRVQLIHIDLVIAGDTIEHNGKIVTVCGKDIKRDRFFGTTIFGDSYNLGYTPVKRIIFS